MEVKLNQVSSAKLYITAELEDYALSASIATDGAKSVISIEGGTVLTNESKEIATFQSVDSKSLTVNYFNMDLLSDVCEIIKEFCISCREQIPATEIKF